MKQVAVSIEGETEPRRCEGESDRMKILQPNIYLLDMKRYGK